MTVEELIELLSLHDKELQVKIVYDGPDAFNYLPIKNVEKSLYHVIIKPDTTDK